VRVESEWLNSVIKIRQGYAIAQVTLGYFDAYPYPYPWGPVPMTHMGLPIKMSPRTAKLVEKWVTANSLASMFCDKVISVQYHLSKPTLVYVVQGPILLNVRPCSCKAIVISESFVLVLFCSLLYPPWTTYMFVLRTQSLVLFPHVIACQWFPAPIMQAYSSLLRQIPWSPIYSLTILCGDVNWHL